MKTIRCRWVIAVALAATSSVSSEAIDARGWLEKAVAAHGGASVLATPFASINRGKVTSRFGGQSLVGGVVLYREGDKARNETSFEMRNGIRESITTWDGHEAWREGFGRRSDMPAVSSIAESEHSPAKALLHATSAIASLKLESSSDDHAVLTFSETAGATLVGIDAKTGFVRFVDYPYPHQSGLDEIKVKRRRDLYDHWELTTGGFAAAKSIRTEIDGVETFSIAVDSIEVVSDLDDSLFHLEDEVEAPLPGDELAD